MSRKKTAKAFSNENAQLFQWDQTANKLSPQNSIRSIAKRIRQKRKSGKRLTASEAYLIRRSRHLKRAMFGPSRLYVFSQILQVFLRPLPIVLVLGLIIASEVNSNAWLSLQVAEEEVASAGVVTADETEIAVDEASFAAEESSETLKLTTPPPRTASEKRGLIEFISGVIAVYTPSISDPGEIAHEIVRISNEENIDPLYVAAVIANESSFRTHARSRVGATGLMQLMKNTAKELATQQAGKKTRPKLTVPSENIKLGIIYLKQLERQYRGNRHLALASYNWGPANVAKARRNNRRFPRSVKRYSTKILEMTLRWQKQFKRTSRRASAFETSLLSDPEKAS